MDLTALFKMTYGLYVVSAEADGQKAGCIINTATQVTAEPPRLTVAVHKDNVTTYIGNFGFSSSADIDKFEKYGCEISAVGSPYSPEHVCAVFACKLIDTVDVGTHFLFVGDVVDAQKLSDEEPLTYSYYHSTLKGKTPPKASSYQG